MSALTDTFTAIANAIRGKLGVQTTYTPTQMSSAIASIPTAKEEQTKSVTATTSQQTVTPDSGKVLSSVTVNPQVHSATYTPTGYSNANDMGAQNNYRYVDTSAYEPTSITPSNSSPVSMTANTGYKPTASGYAISSYIDKTPSASSTPVYNGDIIRVDYSSHPSAPAYLINQYNEITPDDSSPTTLYTGTIYKMFGMGYAIASQPASKTPSNTNPPSVSANQIIKPSASGYLYSTKPTLKKTTLWTNPSPTADFSSQTVTLSSGRSNFAYIGVEYKNSKSGSRYMTAYMSRSDLETSDNQLGLSAYTSAFYNRSVYVTSSNLNAEITIGHCYKLNATGTTNGYCTPYKIYGCNIQ